MSLPTSCHRFALTRGLLTISILFVALLPVAAFAAAIGHGAPGQVVRSGRPYTPAATFVVTTTADSGAGSLRQVILAANSNPGMDILTFAIGALGSQQTISPTSALPNITDPITIDGWSQGGAGYFGPPLIAIDGALAGEVDGPTLDYGSSGSSVRGVAIMGFAHNGLRINSTDNKIQGNYVGLGLDGVTTQGNGNVGDPGYPERWAGINVYGPHNLIGTDSDGVLDTAERNVISGNSDGIDLSYTISNVVAGNFVGTDAAGMNAVPNVYIGVLVEGSRNRIGTDGNGAADESERNIISGNSGAGLFLRFSLSNTIAGNHIGLNAIGDPLGNGTPASEGAGIVVFASNYNTIGTDGSPDAFNAHERNVIAATVADINFEYGDGIQIVDSTDNVVAGNYIGVNAAATMTLGYSNEADGIILYAASNNRIGTNSDGVADADEANIIGGNGAGLWLRESMSNTIAGNFIGADATGLLNLGNEAGIMLGFPRNVASQTSNNQIIGNLIANNIWDGIVGFPTEYPGTPPGDGPADNFIISNTIQHNGNTGISNIGSSPLISANLIVSNSNDGIYNETYVEFNGGDYLSRPDILSNIITDNCAGWSGWPPARGGCAGILSIDTAPNNAAALETDNVPAPNNAYPFIAQRWYGAVEVIQSGVPIVSSVVLSSANGGPTYTFSTTAGPCPTYNNTILHGGPGISCDYGWNWPAITQYIVDETGVRHNYMPLTSSSPARAVYSFDADATTDPTDTGAGFIGEGIQSGPFSRHQIMQITLSDPIDGLLALNDSPTVLSNPTNFTATVVGGTNISYTWNFGDDSTIITGSSAVISHTYSAAGVYTTTVTATNLVSEMTATTSITVFEYPIANLSAGNDSPTVLGVSTIFTATASGSNIVYTWNFGDGSSNVSGATQNHVYPAVGVYTASVTATNSIIAVVTSTPVTITDQPILNLSLVNDSPTVLEAPTIFTATASGSNIVYTWNFGDGSIIVNNISAVISHTYGGVGIYTAIVTATNNISTVNANTSARIARLPVAEAGADRTVLTGQSVFLDGSTSFDPGGYLPLAYDWQQIGGQTIPLIGADQMTGIFTAPQVITQTTILTFSLSVTNTLKFTSQPDLVSIIVEPYRVYLPLISK